jgi:uncharacterized repeat protein (TIGR03803 family)
MTARTTCGLETESEIPEKMNVPIARARTQAKWSLILTVTFALARSFGQPQFNIIYNFTGGTDGAEPVGGLIQSVDGNLYGACAAGGDVTNFGNYFNGTVFRVSTGGSLHTLFEFAPVQTSFDPPNSTGADPIAGVVRGRDGAFYGTTYNAGFSSDPAGVAFRVDSAGNYSVLHSFGSRSNPSEGTAPEARLLQGIDGYLYGETQSGGTNDVGTIFKISPLGDGVYYSVFHQFNGITDGNEPGGGLTQGPDGFMWGMTFNMPEIFKIDTQGNFHVVHPFINTASDGQLAGSATDNSLVWYQGYAYGAAPEGGTNNSGTVFRIDTNGNFSVIYTFTATDGNGFNADGASPNGVIVGSDGNLYGTAQNGGTNGEGTIFMVTTNGGFTNLYTFNGVTDGGQPQCGLREASDGNLYGLVESGGSQGGGIVYQITGLLLPPPAPILVAVGKSGHTFTLNLFGTTNNNYQVQATTNLAAGPSGWVNLTNFVPPTSPFAVLDPAATNSSRFYRAVTP